MDWERYCNWDYEIQPLACFLNDPNYTAPTWGPLVMWLGPILFLAVGALIEYLGKGKP